VDVPQTLEGWYTLHDVWNVDWAAWALLSDDERRSVLDEARAWLESASSVRRGDTAMYSVLSQKGDLMFVHYRESPEALNAVELALRQTALYGFLQPTYSYVSLIEVSLNEVMGIAAKRLSDRGLNRGDEGFDEAWTEAVEEQREKMKERLYRDVPPQKYISFYPMDKKRGETVNWYTLSAAERRDMMRGHGSVGHKYHEVVTQVIGGSIGLDDWEWGVSLHSDDMLVFKKLVHEMRFDPASALYAEFGPFYLGIRSSAGSLGLLLSGHAPS